MRLFAATPVMLFMALALSGCGGGGGGGNDGGSSPSPDPVTPPVTPPPEPTYSLSGTISAADSQVVDSDTNDPTREAIGNDTFLTAQPIPNPVTIGGYVNRPGTGEPGRSQISGDIDDYFAVELLAGQRVTMLVANFDEADADLYLYTPAGEIVDFSIDTGEIESLLIAEDGDYLINAFAFTGATNYTLAIGAPASAQTLPEATSQSVSQHSSQHDIVPWEAVVKYRDNITVSSAAASARTAAVQWGMHEAAGGAGRDRLLAMQRATADPQRLKARTGNAMHKSAALANDALRARWETLQTIKRLRTDPRVEFAEPNYRIRPLLVPNDEAFALQWHYPLIALPDAWNTTTGDENVIVAVIDTGVLPSHPDLLGQFVGGYDFVRDAENAADGNGIDPNPTDPGDIQGNGSGFHGTHVSGTVVARGNNGRGVAGVAYTSKVMPLRALGTDGGTTYDLGQAIRYAAGLGNDSGTLPTRSADIINLSLGGGGFSQSLQNLLQQVRQRGIFVVAAAGNEASSAPGYPAAYEGVISVSAVDSQGRLAPYSNTGSTIDVAAPGGNSGVDLTGDGYPDGVLSTSANSSDGQLNYVYSFLNGTSMASPHVAGVIALMKSINPALSPGDFDAMLIAGSLTDDSGAPGRDNQFGYGLINANLAVNAALESIGSSPADNPRLVSSVGNLNFGATITELGITLRNAGQGELEILSIEASETWLSARPVNTDDNQLGDYTIAIDRSALTPGVYAADLVATSSVNTVSIRVFASVGGAAFASDVGVLYVLLYDPATDSTAAQFVASGRNGDYSFRFDDVTAGEYEIIAGSDKDNDLLICDAGESCGAYLTVDQPIRLTINADRVGLDFPAEFVVSLPSLQGAAHNSTTGKTFKLRPTAQDDNDPARTRQLQ